MRLIWHIIRKDIVRERWALLLWAALTIGQVAIGVFARLNNGSERDWVTSLQTGIFWLVALRVIMGYILVARLVQADALIGTGMFWPTRPISAARLFAAKALGALLLFGLLPVLLQLPWWLYCDFGWREVWWTAVDLLGWQLLIIGPGFLVASLTDDLGRVLLWTLLLVIGLFSWIVLLQATFGTASDKDPYRIGSGVIFTRVWLSAAVFGSGGLAIALHQYLTRRFVRSVVLVAGGLGLIALIGQWCPWNWAEFIGRQSQPVSASVDPGVVDDLKFSVLPSRGNFGRRDPGAKNDGSALDATLHGQLRVSGLPEEMSIAAESKPSVWRWADGMKLERNEAYYAAYDSNDPATALLRRTYGLTVPVEDPETVQWGKDRRELVNARIRARGDQPPVLIAPEESTVPGVRLRGYTTLPNSYLAKMREQPPAFSSNLQFILYQPAVVADLPLQAGVQASGHAQTLHVWRIQGDVLTLVTTRSSVATLGLWFSGVARSNFQNWLFRDRFLAVNHSTGGIYGVGENQTGSRMLQVAGVTVNWNLMRILPQTVIREGKWVVADPQWRDHTTLVNVTDVEAVRFKREVRTDRLEVRAEIVRQPTEASVSKETAKQP